MTTPDEPAPARPFWQVATTPRMLGLLVVFLVVAAGCAALGSWQLDRARERAQLEAIQIETEQDAGGPQPLAGVLAPQTEFPGEVVGRAVTFSGEYDAAGQRYVAGRTVEGRTGFLVLTPMRVIEDGSGGASWAALSGAPTMPVVRGWSPDLATATASRPPSGTVEMTAYLQAAEAAGDPIGADGTMAMISSAQLVADWGGPIYSGYAVLSASDPAEAGDLVTVPRPQIEGHEGLNMQNLFYALEWWVFGGFAVALWIRMVRDESRGGKDPLELATV